jgi:hypothetical protein
MPAWPDLVLACITPAQILLTIAMPIVFRLMTTLFPLEATKACSEANALKSYRDYYKRLLDITAICTGVWYLLNIVDAAVDAHLFEWNMRNDLNVSWRPEIITPAGNYPQASVGASVRLRF